MTGWELRPSVTPSLQDRTELEEILPWPAWEWHVNLYMGRGENICGVELGPVWSYLCMLIILFVFKSVFKKKPHWLGNNVSSSPICFCVGMLPKYYVCHCLLSYIVFLWSELQVTFSYLDQTPWGLWRSFVRSHTETASDLGVHGDCSFFIHIT